MENSAFYYVDGITTKGLWIDLEIVDSYQDILEQLAKSNYIPRDQEDKPDYDGSLLIADVEGALAHCFESDCGAFDLAGFIKARDSDVDADVVAAYIDIFEEWDEERCQSIYYGFYESERDFAEAYIKSGGYFAEVPEDIQFYMNYQGYGEELLINDFKAANNHYFHNPRTS